MAGTALGLAPASASAAGSIMAGADVEDASWHVGASAGQYASDGTFAETDGTDPTHHSTRRVPSYGIQSRLSVRAIVVKGPDGRLLAIVKNDFYIPQDLIYRRLVQLLEADGTGIGRGNLSMMVTHNHSSPYYSSTSWGVWTFQDVFDFRFFEYMAQKMKTAVENAKAKLRPVRVGAAVRQFDFVHRNVPGPNVADDGTPAGYPRNYTDHDLTVIRFEDAATGRPVANLVNYAVHPEDLEGNDLISAAFVGPFERFTDRQLGGVTVWTQGAVGNSEPEENDWHSIHDRAYFSHAQYQQSEWEARLLANQVAAASNEIKSGRPEDPSRFVPLRSSFDPGDVAFADRWFPGPASHPYPGVSSCRTEAALEGDPRAPIVGLPECEGAGGIGVDASKDPGITTSTIKQFGIPVPDNYSAPSYTGLEEDVSVHMQAFRIGDILFTVCSCEQWADQSKNIKTRTNRTPGDEWIGYDWAPKCRKRGDGNWDCPNPGDESKLLPPISDHLYQVMKAEVENPANGWDSLANAPFAESENPDPSKIWGNYTQDDTPANAALGYKLTVAMSQGNDYNGYITTFREYQRGDHYRKSLDAWGPHASDYYATRLSNMGRWLHDPSKPDPYPIMPGGVDAVDEWPGGGAKTLADLSFNDQRARTIGEIAANGIKAYEAQLPDDGPAKIAAQPSDVRRFAAAFLTWDGGSNYTDNPSVRVQRRVGSGWDDYADQSGELPVTIKFPSAGELPAYRVGGYTFKWTAHFEAFVSSFELGDRPRATPPGTYRFVVDGKRREGGQVRSYHLESRSFQVLPWDGIRANDLRSDDGVVSFRAGPEHVLDVPGDGGSLKPLKATIGPIDYPDSYKSNAKYIDPRRYAFRDRAAPNDPSKLEWYCRPNPDDDSIKKHGCSFRPWLDRGDAERAIVTFVKRDGKTERVKAHASGGRWVADRKLGSGEAAYVESGDVCDQWDDYNGAPSAKLGTRVPKDPPAGYSCVPKSIRAALGLPSTKRCLDRRKFKFRIHQPPKRRIIAIDVYVNGKRRYHRHGHRIRSVTIKRLPKNKRTYRVKIVALTNHGERVISVRKYRNCKKTRPHTRVKHKHGKHRSRHGGKHGRRATFGR